MKANNEKKSKQPITINYENKKLSVTYFIPLLLIAGFVPLITYAKLIDLTGTTQSLYWTGQQTYLDFFSYWKSRWVMILTLISLIMYVALYLQKKLPLKNLKQYYIPLGIYAIFVIISTIFAIDVPTALWGFVDMEQGMFVLLSYVALTFLTINFVNNERDVNLFVKAFLFLMIVEGVLGVGQYFGHDFFKTALGNKLIVPGNIQVENLEFSFGPKTIYGTLFNTNFVGSFATLMLPLSIGILLGSKTKKQKIVAGIAVVLMIFVWIGCNSRAGYLGVAVSAVFALVLARKVIFRYKKTMVGLFAIMLLLLIGLNSVSEGALFNRISTFNLVKEIESLKEKDKVSFKFEDIILNKDTVSVKTNRQILNLKVDGEKLYFLDENNVELEIETKGNVVSIKDFDRYWEISKITIPENYPGVTISTHGGYSTTNFYITQDGFKILGSGGRITEPIAAERIESLDGLEMFMSGRGYIWSRTIPMLKNHFISGSGSDNFPMAFPQDDFIAKLNIYMDANTVVDKPHDMFLQVAINTGLISLVSLILVWGMYLVSCFKLYSKITFDSLEKYIGASCVISVIGYLFAGIFNDHIVAVSPLFWLILGIGISINYRIKRNIIKQQ